MKLEASHATKVRALETERDEARKSTTDLQARICANCVDSLNELESKEREVVQLTRRVAQLEQSAGIKDQVDVEGLEQMKSVRRELEDYQQRCNELERELEKVEGDRARAEQDLSELKQFMKNEHDQK